MRQIASTTSPQLIAYLRGPLRCADLPEIITLEDTVWQDMDDLWQRSIAHIAQGQVCEWGGALVLENQNLRLVNICQGQAKNVQVICPDVPSAI